MDDMIVNKLGFWRGFVRCEKGEDRKNRVFLCRERERVCFFRGRWMDDGRRGAANTFFMCMLENRHTICVIIKEN